MSKFSLINNEAHKRLFSPDRRRFTCYTTCDNGEYVLRNNKGETLYRFNDENEMQQKAQSIVDSLLNLYYILERDAMIHKLKHTKYYEKTYEEANFTHRAILNGFKPTPEYFNPYSNWYGVSGCFYEGYTPDATLARGNKTIELSLQGMFMPMPNPIFEGFYELADNMALKYLGFFIDGKPKYETWTGNLPSAEFIEEFIAPETNSNL